MRNVRTATTVAWWNGKLGPEATPDELKKAIARIGDALVLYRTKSGHEVGRSGLIALQRARPDDESKEVAALVPGFRLEDLGDGEFCRDHGLQYPYIAGAMANGISSPELVMAMSRAGMLGMFGAAGLMPDAIEESLDRISTRLGRKPWGSNLIHSPFEPALEDNVVDLYLRRGVRLVSASAYIDLTLPLLRYRFHGIYRDPDGAVVTPNHLIAKVSREEVAHRFLSPPPSRMLAELVTRGELTETEAEMAAQLPVAQDLIAEADSGGHTDKQPALAQLPTLLALRDRLQRQHDYPVRLRVGAAGGIATPHSAAAAFAMGAAFVVTGSINQACREAGTSDTVREMLASAGQADVTMAPAADMFEMGVDLQVLKRGTMFALRAHKLRHLYRTHDSLDDIPEADRAKIEKAVFRAPLDEIWEQTEKFWLRRDPQQVERAEADSKHKMALVFRWYLGMSSRWANSGEHGRYADYQVWCGPAMGAFNQWTRGSFLGDWRERSVVPAAMNILYGAAVLARARAIGQQGVPLDPDALDLTPKPLADLEEYLR